MYTHNSMCLIGIRWRPEAAPKEPALIIAANRDELFERPSKAAHFWPSKPNIFAGQDEVMGGTWLGCSKTGRMAVLTNYHDDRGDEDEETPSKKEGYTISRGEIPVNFLDSSASSSEYAKQLEEAKDSYDGFNILLFDGSTLICCSNRAPTSFAQELSPGTYALSNHLLDTPWPKVIKLKKAFGEIVPTDHSHETIWKKLFLALQNQTIDMDVSKLPTLREKWEVILQHAVFVREPTNRYGTRTSTLVTYNKQVDSFQITEHNYATPSSPADSTVHETIHIARS